MKGVGFAYREEFGEECRGTLGPDVDSFPVLVEPLFLPPKEGEWKRMESDDLGVDSLYDDGVTKF
jgi:hypothetical protein